MDVYLHKKTNKILKNNSKIIQKNKIYKVQLKFGVDQKNSTPYNLDTIL
nr:hypothetical protein [Buchnera aphidicola]